MKNMITIPRIIGIVLIILAVLAYNAQQGMFRAGIIALIGLIMLFTPQKTAAKHWKVFVDTFKFKKEFAVIMLLDALFWAALAVILLILANVLQGPYQQMKSIQLGSGLNIESIGAYNTIIEQFFTSVIITIIVFWILAVIVYSISRGLIWLTLLNKKGSTSFFVRFSLLNIVWCTIWLAATLFFTGALAQPFGAVAFIILLIIYTHLTTVLHNAYTKSPGFGSSIKNAFGIGLGKISGFIHLYCYLFIVYIILYQLQRFTTATTTILIVTFVIFIAFMAWYRKYLRNVLRHI